MSTTISNDRLPAWPDEDTCVLNGLPNSGVRSTYPFLRPPGGAGELGRLGDYRVLRLLGAGGMGKVFLAEDQTLKRPVALKVMTLPPGEDLLSGSERFLREARALAAIKHPNLVSVYQGGQDGGTIFLAMELLEGETLEARLRRESPIEMDELLRIAEQLATGLAAVHERRLIHRDIKPSNIWLLSEENQDTEPMDGEPSDAGAQVKILDFGLVREIQSDTQLTEAGMVMGTPAYMSPEQVRGRPLDCRTDLFSLGCVLYAMATGRAPFEASGAMAQAAALAADEPVRARKLNPAIPKSLSKLIAELLAKNPDDRPDSAREVLARLREMAPRPQPAKSVATPQRSFLRRHAVKFVALVWLVLAVLIGAVVAGGKREPDVLDSVSPPPAEPPVEYLCELPKTGERPFPPPGAPAPPGVDGSVWVRGDRSPHGIFMHGSGEYAPPTYISYALNRQYSRFTTDVAMNDTAVGWAALHFVVIADGRKAWESRRMSVGALPERCDLDVRGVGVLTLEVRTVGHSRGAHGAWVEPRLTK